jgi:hypothetical protein
MRSQFGQIAENSISKSVSKETPCFDRAVESLQEHLEFIDETDAEIYGARIWLVPNQQGLMYLLRSGGEKHQG